MYYEKNCNTTYHSTIHHSSLSTRENHASTGNEQQTGSGKLSLRLIMHDGSGWITTTCCGELDQNVENPHQTINSSLKVQNNTRTSARLQLQGTIFTCEYHECVVRTDYEIHMIHKKQICTLKEFYQDPRVCKIIFWIVCPQLFQHVLLQGKCEPNLIKRIWDKPL
jgi:hypothetical protein